MKHLKTYKIFESNDISIEDDIKDIMIELEDEGLKVEVSFWVKGAKGGFLRSNEKGEWLYGPKPTDDRLFLKVEVRKSVDSEIDRTNDYLWKSEGFDWIEVKPYFDRLREFIEKYSPVKYKINTMIFRHMPRFSTKNPFNTDESDKYQTGFDYIGSKYIEKDFTDKNTLTSVNYFFERI